MEAKHTQGEWHLPHFARMTDKQSCDCGFIFANECEQCIATVHYKKDDSIGQSESPELETAIANAKRICAAPDLFEALEEIIQVKHWKDKFGKDEYYLRAQPIAWNNAKEAIKKATE